MNTNTYNKFARLMQACLLLLLLTSCEGNSRGEIRVPQVGEEVFILPGVKVDQTNIFFDDFSDGVAFDDWNIGAGAWGNGNGGVIPENVFYTDAGHLLLRGHGQYYTRGEVRGLGSLKDGRNTGAALISKFATGPGHYEVKMKPLPRQGACTAFWTYMNRLVDGQAERDNHEIDIELPGGNRRGVISFKNILNTNYVTESLMISSDISVFEATAGKTAYLNDNQFHTFAFDWYTDPEMVVYSLDGYVTAVHDSFVPKVSGRLWLGNWFPNNAGFVGLSNFETDYMVVDWVQYLPFLNQPYEEYEAMIELGVANASQYPRQPIVMPKVNLIANGDFEYFTTHGTQENYGWTFASVNQIDSEENCYLENHPTEEHGVVAVLKNGGFLHTIIDSVYEQQEFTLTFQAKCSGTGQMTVKYQDATGTSLDKISIAISGDQWQNYSLDFTAPTDCNSLQILATMLQANQTLQIDNVELTRR
ncbi:MAG: glycoside hydrolase family 16 protein [Bacilli bacterium]